MSVGNYFLQCGKTDPVKQACRSLVSAICKEKTMSVGNYFLQCGKTDPVKQACRSLVFAICKEKTKSVGNYFLQCTNTNPVEHVGPTLQGDALEHCQHRLTKVVEARDAPLRTLHTWIKGSISRDSNQ
jgi:hypothetical protein